MRRRDTRRRRHRQRAFVAQVHTILANGDVAQGWSYLSEATCRSALRVQIEGTDLILGIPVRLGLGFAVGGTFMPNPNTLYWAGAGGSLAIIDMDPRASYAYPMKRVAAAPATRAGSDLSPPSGRPSPELAGRLGSEAPPPRTRPA